jgi:phospholipase C
MRWLPLTDKISTTSTDTSMHPNSDIRPGENYLAAVYKTLRNSPCWNDTLLIVTFDENGGLYDHVAPPATKAPNSKTGSEYDQYLGAECTFDFTLLGPRIPALLVSPWLRPGIATHQFQNTSVLRLIEDLIGSPCLNARDGNAPKLDCIFDDFGLPQPRTDCPASFPGYPGFPYADGDLGKIYVVPPGAKGAAPRYMAHLARIYGIAE